MLSRQLLRQAAIIEQLRVGRAHNGVKTVLLDDVSLQNLKLNLIFDLIPILTMLVFHFTNMILIRNRPDLMVDRLLVFLRIQSLQLFLRTLSCSDQMKTILIQFNKRIITLQRHPLLILTRILPQIGHLLLNNLLHFCPQIDAKLLELVSVAGLSCCRHDLSIQLPQLVLQLQIARFQLIDLLLENRLNERIGLNLLLQRGDCRILRCHILFNHLFLAHQVLNLRIILLAGRHHGPQASLRKIVHDVLLDLII